MPVRHGILGSNSTAYTSDSECPRKHFMLTSADPLTAITVSNWTARTCRMVLAIVP